MRRGRPAGRTMCLRCGGGAAVSSLLPLFPQRFGGVFLGVLARNKDLRRTSIAGVCRRLRSGIRLHRTRREMSGKVARAHEYNQLHHAADHAQPARRRGVPASAVTRRTKPTRRRGFCELAAWHGIKTHNAIKALHLDELFGSKAGGCKPGATIEKLPSKYKARPEVERQPQARPGRRVRGDGRRR